MKTTKTILLPMIGAALAAVAEQADLPIGSTTDGARHPNLAILATPQTFTCKLQGIYLTRSIDVNSADSAIRRTDSAATKHMTASETLAVASERSQFEKAGSIIEQKKNDSSQLSAEGGIGLKWGIIPHASFSFNGSANHVNSFDSRRNREQGTTDKTDTSVATSLSSETSRSDSVETGRTETDETKRGSYRLHFSVLLRNTDTTDTLVIDRTRVKATLTGPDLTGVLIVPYRGKGEIQLGAESTVLDFEAEITDEHQLRNLLRLQNEGSLPQLRLMVSGADIPAISEKTGKNILAEQAKMDRRRPGPRIAVEFDELQELSPWRVSGRHTAESGEPGTPVTLREALRAVGSAARKQMDTLPKTVFSFSKDGNLRQVIDHPLLEKTGPEEYRMFAVRLTREKNGETETEVRLPLSPVLNRRIAAYSEIALIDFSFTELAQAVVLHSAYFASLQKDVEEYLSKIDKTALTIWKKRLDDSQQRDDESPLPEDPAIVSVFDVERFRRRAEAGVSNMQFKLAVCLHYGWGVAKDEKQAVEWYHKAAIQGHSRAQFQLGWCYSLGEGVDGDFETAIEWYRKAAEQGYTAAQKNMGLFYLQGLGVEKDAKIALDWFRKAAEQGDVKDQVFLAELLFEGNFGIEKDLGKAAWWYLQAAKQEDPKAIFGYGRCLEEGALMGGRYVEAAVTWYRQAAEKGHVDAQVKLASCYAEGNGVPTDEKQAAYWYQKAAEQGDARAQGMLSLYYRDGIGVEKDPKQAFFWAHEVAVQDPARGQYMMGSYYFFGIGVEKDPVKAAECYRKAAEQDVPEAQLCLGELYADGIGVEKDLTKAIHWLNKAVETDKEPFHTNQYQVARDKLARCCYKLAMCYNNGEGMRKDVDKGFEWTLKSANYGFAPAQYLLGRYFYGEGVVVEKDMPKAVDWLRKAAEQGLVEAQGYLGICYENGDGVPKDITMAREWYRKAADQGDTIAQEALKRLSQTR